MVRKTKIVCTMGPSCWDEDTLGALIDAGMNVVRFNFSHGDHAGHAEVLARVRKVGWCNSKKLKSMHTQPHMGLMVMVFGGSQ